MGIIFIVPLRRLLKQFEGFQHQHPTITINNTNSKQLIHHHASVISLRLSPDEQMLYSGSLDKDCIWWNLPTRQICFKNSFPKPITNMLLAKLDTNDANEGSNISTPFTTFSSETTEEATLSSRNGHNRRPTNNDDLIRFMPMPPVDGEADESAIMAASTFTQTARLVLEQQMNSSDV